METPFFANRLAVGNAVVGAWFKTFTTKELKKKWWECEPQMVSFENGKSIDLKIRFITFYSLIRTWFQVLESNF